MSNTTNDDTRTRGNSRRRVLKTALLGGASVTAFKLAPESWTRPVVEAVSLPAHAQTSLVLPDGPWAGGGNTGNAGPGPARQRGLGGQILNAILPEARAGGSSQPDCEAEAIFNICIERVDADTLYVQIGFDDVFLDDRNVGTAVNGGLITFSGSFGDWLVNGELSADGETWTGWVEGPCPRVRDANLAPERNDTSDPLQRMRTAVVDTLIPAARAGLEIGDADQQWTAIRNAECVLLRLQ
ncbi:MAG: hypothetical protein U5R46_14045 [Gammaproteobacteria bacterium]|nr:hypothetical protein [Gammaproteobacteria bacterium]